MAANTTIQVDRAQKAAYAAGFKRGEFTAQTERVYRGRRNGYAMYDYGDLLFYVKGGNEDRRYEAAKRMILQGYDVEIMYYNDKIAHISFSETRMPSGVGVIWQDFQVTIGPRYRRRMI